MEEIDERRALELLIDVVDQAGDDFVYEKVKLASGNDGCRYVMDGKPSCLVGHALVRAGCEISILEDLDSPGVSAVDLRSHLTWVTDGASEVFFAAQQVQDDGRTWGDAIGAAKVEYEAWRRMRDE